MGRGVKFLLISIMIQLKGGLWFYFDSVFVFNFDIRHKTRQMSPTLNLDLQVG